MNISRLNFPQTLPFIKKTIAKSHYVSFDLEMSGIVSDRQTNPSLVDSMQERYLKLKYRIEKFIPLQLGVCCHHVNIPQNKVEFYPFNFYIYPLIINDSDSIKFSFNAGTVNFLANNNFDFNKLFYEYVPYINQEDKMRSVQRNQSIKFTKQLARLDMLYSPYTKAFFMVKMPIFEEWVRKINATKQGNLQQRQIQELKTLKIDIKFIKYKTYTLLIDQIQRKYPSMSLSFEFDSNAIYQRKSMTIKMDKKLQTVTQNKSNQKMRNLTGNNTNFTNDQLLVNEVIETISNKKIPIVVHNGLLDLMHIYYRFFKDLPPTWKSFAKNVRKIFPYIYDTKYICQNNPVIVNSLDNRQTNLEACYNFFRGQEKDFSITLDERFQQYKLEDCASHEAGFDALMTGYVFFSSMNALKRPLSSIIDPEFHKGKSLMRNRVPLGNMRVPINFQDTQVDIYSQDGQNVLMFRSILNQKINQIQITNLLKEYGSFSFVWKSQEMSQFYIIFVDKNDLQKFKNKFLDKEYIGIAKLDGIKFLVCSTKTTNMATKTQIKKAIQDKQQTKNKLNKQEQKDQLSAL